MYRVTVPIRAKRKKEDRPEPCLEQNPIILARNQLL
jgi:hypothetical protein